MGHGILFGSRNNFTRFDLYGHGDRDDLIVSRLSRGVNAKGRGATRLHPVAMKPNRVAEEKELAILRQQILGVGGLLRHDIFRVDYLPWIRHLAAGDDEEERKRSHLGLALGGRRTRNSQFQDYYRTIPLTTEQRQALERTALSG